MAVYDLPLESDNFFRQEGTTKKAFAPLPIHLLVKYALWFCRFRWVVVIILGSFGLFGFFPDFILFFGLKPQTSWAFFIALFLGITNMGYLQHVKKMKKAEKYDRIMVNIWIQVILDLIILTGVIHYSGSLETLVRFTYLFHIVLACIFFTSRKSLWVTIFVCILYVMCLSAEEFGIIPVAGIYLNNSIRTLFELNKTFAAFNVISSIGIWLIIWYLASYLSNMVREREYELTETNKRLSDVQREKTKHMVRTTHELKAPFAAIDANLQLLLKGHCGVLPDSAIEVMERIIERSRRLGIEIQEMLQLSNLRTENHKPFHMEKIELVDVIQWCKNQVQPMAEKKGIVFDEDLQPASINAVIYNMKMLFVNIRSNSVSYSHMDGRVLIKCINSVETGPLVLIEDSGIGISENKISKIFDEYYRTDEAVRYNKNSTGLGLAIVKFVAKKHKIHVRVESLKGVGTKFILRFAPIEQKKNVLLSAY